MLQPKFVLKNQFGEESICYVLQDVNPYDGEGSYQVLPIDMNLDAGVGSDDPTDPSFVAPIMGNIIGDDLTEAANYLAGVIGAYSLTGTKGSDYPTAGVLGIISDEVVSCDGAVVAHIDGDSGVTTANAAFKATMKNSTAGSGFDYGVDLYYPAADGYLALAILKADLRLSNQVCVLNGATAPVDGTTGDNFAGPGSLYIARDTGIPYYQSGLITNPTWLALGSAASVASLQNGTFTPTVQTLSAAGAISTTSMETLINNASGSGIAVTLAAPSSQDGQIKIIKMGTATNNATLAMTNIDMSGGYTPTGTTTITFSSTGHSAVLMAVGAKWVYLGGSAAVS